MTGRKTTLQKYRQTKGKFQVPIASRESPLCKLSILLHLFYDAGLREICDRQDAKASAIGLVDDVNV